MTNTLDLFRRRRATEIRPFQTDDARSEFLAQLCAARGLKFQEKEEDHATQPPTPAR